MAFWRTELAEHRGAVRARLANREWMAEGKDRFPHYLALGLVPQTARGNVLAARALDTEQELARAHEFDTHSENAPANSATYKLYDLSQ